MNGKGQRFHGWIVPRSLGPVSVLNFTSFHSPIIGLTVQKAHCLQAAEGSPLLRETEQLLTLWHILLQKHVRRMAIYHWKRGKWTWGLDSSVLWKDPVSEFAASSAKRGLKKPLVAPCEGPCPLQWASRQLPVFISLSPSFHLSVQSDRGRERHTHNFTSTEPTPGTFDILAASFPFSSCAKSRNMLGKETSA